ncbi:SDR family NAD(P)-dependent oxidoreductase [Jiangella endophytica]|uniref:SDR family NAD(P)-dependent oxidoreductase n=1 Tax=Jiangella endophytica TaxID=1623398 RepID=UPI000E343B94|nr:SDR family NAD(P)-dependent oxidoreductase [Jiangella endophytica]
MIDLRGRTAIVTGGASNIGRGITLRLAEQGARVVILDRDLEQAEKTAADADGEVSAVAADLLDPGSLRTAVDGLASPVDILVNNAGWVHTVGFLEKDPAEVELEIRLNLLGPMLLTQLVVPGMVERGWGRVVSIASEAGRAGQRGQVAYSGAKGGILGMTRSLSHEVGRHGVTVNAVSPAMTVPESDGDIGTGSMQQSRDRPPEVMAKIVKLYPVGRVGHPRDIAAAVAFLCSEEAGFITGQTLPVNGGFVTT